MALLRNHWGWCLLPCGFYLCLMDRISISLYNLLLLMASWSLDDMLLELSWACHIWGPCVSCLLPLRLSEGPHLRLTFCLVLLTSFPWPAWINQVRFQRLEGLSLPSGDTWVLLSCSWLLWRLDSGLIALEFCVRLWLCTPFKCWRKHVGGGPRLYETLRKWPFGWFPYP